MTINQERKFLIEKVAEDFVQTILKDHPVMLYELDRELSEYITNNEQIDKKLKDKSLHSLLCFGGDEYQSKAG